MWSRVRRELATFRGILPFLQHDCCRRALPVVVAQNAAGPCSISKHKYGAYCVAAGTPPTSDISMLLRQQWAKTKAHIPHSHDTNFSMHDLLAMTPFERGSPLGGFADSYATQLLRRMHLPRSWFDESADITWHTLQAKHWSFSMHINRGVSRGCYQFARHLQFCMASPSDRWEPLDLSDNSAMTGSWQDGRSSSWPLNSECRRVAALEGFFNVRSTVSWIDTLHQSGDDGTREKDGHLCIDLHICFHRRLAIEVFVGEGGASPMRVMLLDLLAKCGTYFFGASTI